MKRCVTYIFLSLFIGCGGQVDSAPDAGPACVIDDPPGCGALGAACCHDPCNRGGWGCRADYECLNVNYIDGGRAILGDALCYDAGTFATFNDR